MDTLSLLDQLTIEPAAKEQLAAAIKSLMEKGKRDDLVIQALKLEFAHLRRIRFGIKNEALSHAQLDLFNETVGEDIAAIAAEQGIWFSRHQADCVSPDNTIASSCCCQYA